MYEKVTPMESFIAALNFGTNEIRGVIGKKDSNGMVQILKEKTVTSEGITRGIIINVDSVARKVREIVMDLERSSGKKIEKLYAGSGGCMVYAKQNSAYKRLSQKGEFSTEIIEELSRENASIELGYDAEIISILNQGYIVDDEFTVADPVGVHGSKIEGDYLIMGIKSSDKQTIKRCIEKAGYGLADIILEPLAVSESVLSNEEKDLGAVAVDFGAGKTSVVVYHEGKIKRMAVLPFGGIVVTKDIVNGCNIIWDKAEKAKLKHGSALAELQSEDDRITIPANGGWEARELSFKTIAYIIQARVEEIISNVLNQVEKSGVYEKLGAGIVLTGGGAALKDVLKLVKQKTGLDVRLDEETLNSESSAIRVLAALVEKGNENCVKKEEFQSLNHKKPKQKKQKVERTGNLFGNLLKSVDNFFDDEDKSM